MKRISKERICIKGQTGKHIPIIFLSVFLAAYLFFGTQTAFSKNNKSLDGEIIHIQGGNENPWNLLDNNISPKDLKIITIERLSSIKNNKELLVKTLSKKIISDIDNAIFHINKSLKEDLWKDSRHLDWAEGALVFNAEGRAAQCLEKIKKYDNEIIKNIATEALHNLVYADYILAMTVLNEAQAYTNTSETIKYTSEKVRNIYQQEKTHGKIRKRPLNTSENHGILPLWHWKSSQPFQSMHLLPLYPLMELQP